MKRIIYLCMFIAVALVSCNKDDDSKSASFGEFSIDNTLTFNSSSQTYESEAFSFQEGRKKFIVSGEKDCITVYFDGSNTYIQTSNFDDSFYLYDTFSDANAALEEFDNMEYPSVTDWEAWAYPISENQIWIFRTSENKLVKFWVKVISYGDDNYVKCTIRWACR